MPKISAGLLMHRTREGRLEYFLVHPGGPFWARKDAGAWFIPKGEVNPGETFFEAAKREFEEEIGFEPKADFLPLGHVKQKSGKVVHAWAFEGDCDPSAIKSNTFTLEWPPKSGKQREFPEIDRAAFFNIEQAKNKIHPAEFAFVERLNSATQPR